MSEEEDIPSDHSSEDEHEEDDSDGEDEEVAETIRNFKSKLIDSPLDYQTYIDFINFAKSHGELEELRYAREEMSRRFPLSPSLWLEWIADEKSAMGSGEDDFNTIVQLFERAVKDYSSVDVWIEYAQFAMSGMSTREGVERVRNIINRGLADVGLHTAKGSLLWDLLRVFENLLLTHKTVEGDEGFSEQTHRIFDTFKRQLSVPLLNMESTLKEYEEFVQEMSIKKEDDIRNVHSLYGTAVKQLEKLKPYEDALLSSQESHLEEYKKYIEFAEENLTPAAIQCIYERAITDNPLDIDLWQRYLAYLDKKLKIQEISMKAYERSVRNCYWSGILWSQYISSMERYKVDLSAIINIFEKGLRAGLASGSDFKDLWISYLSCLRRRTNFEDEKEVETLRKTFNSASDHLASIDGADPDFSVLQYSARVEAVFCKSIENAREIFENMLEIRELSCKASLWIEYFNLEYAFGDRKAARKILTRALHPSIDWLESVGHLLLKLEREEGDSLESYEKVSAKYEQVLKKVNDRRMKEGEKAGIVSHGSATRQPEQSNPRKRKADKEHDEKVFKKPNLPSDKQKATATKDSSKQETTETPHYVRPKEQRSDTDDLLTVFVSNLDFKVDDDRLRQDFSAFGDITDIRLVRNYKGFSKGFGYIQFSNVEGVHRALAADRFKIDGRPVFITEAGKKKGFNFKEGPENHKLFVSNLAPDVDEEYLRSIFEKYGQLKDVRVVTYRNGHSKGCAYVEFADEIAARAGLAADGLLVKAKNIKVAISDPTRRKGSGNTTTEAPKSLGSGMTSTSSRGVSGRQRIAVPFIPTSVRRNIPSKNGSVTDNSH